MKIIKAKVDWRWDYGNLPEFQILVDKIPDHKSVLHEEIAPKVYYAEVDGYVSFFVNPGGRGALGGYVKNITGTGCIGGEKYIGGAWSSRAGCLNTLQGIQVADVCMTNNPENFDRGWTFMLRHVTLALLKEAAILADVPLAKCTDSNGEITFQPINTDASIGPEGIKNASRYIKVEEI